MEATSEFKLAAASLVFLAGIGGAAFARYLMSWPSSATVTRLANCFAGGVFLGAGLIHMLPDAHANIQSVFRDMQYPHFMLVAGVAFLLVLFVDKVVTFPKFSHTATGPDGGTAYPYFLALLLSVHSVITGIALGLEQTLIGAIAILVAVLAHKSIAAMALGISDASPADSRSGHAGIDSIRPVSGWHRGTRWQNPRHLGRQQAPGHHRSAGESMGCDVEFLPGQL